ncbi:MAG: molybdenum cofactor biosynthesis protein MoaE [Devosiaceae bacterium]|nr:molybdenum cofactor biosynthesis protein MoaE [Devosiaceae bacterium MH13]
MIDVKVQAEPLALEPAQAEVADHAVGAVVSFIGYCRDENGALAALELEHYAGMAEASLEDLARQAAERWPLSAVQVQHRYGRITPGEAIVQVVTASAHRRAAFEAADFMMDYLKTNAPFWKKEHPAHAGEAAKWVDAKPQDDADAARWQA